MSARRIEAVRNEPLHAQLAHVAERHWLAGWLFLIGHAHFREDR
jgi:hypothetical protein